MTDILTDIREAMNKIELAERRGVEKFVLSPEVRRDIVVNMPRELQPWQNGILETLFGVPVVTSPAVPPGQFYAVPATNKFHTGGLMSPPPTPKKETTMSITERHLREVAEEQAKNDAIEAAETMLAKVVEYDFQDGDALRFSTKGRDNTELWYAVIRSGGAWFSTGGVNRLYRADDIALAAFLTDLGVNLDAVEVSNNLEAQ